MSTSIATSSISDTIVTLLPGRVEPARLNHIQGVIHTAVELAHRFDIDPERARLAAAAHDLDRDLTAGEGLALAADWDIPLTTEERLHPTLLHGALSAERLRRWYAVEDEELLHAVRHHTLGAADFGPLGMILYVADFCEPGRPYLSDAERHEILRLRSLPEMVRAVIELAHARFGRLAPATAALLEQVSKE